MQDKCVHIGMDLGTFKTSVASSTGSREVLQSAVGWPKDQVARSLLGRDIVFGKDLIEHRMAMHIIRPFEKGALKYTDAKDAGVAADKVALHKQAAKLLVEHAVALSQPPRGLPVYGVIGAPSRANALNKAVLLDAAQDAFTGVMIVSEPFCIAYGMNRLTDTLVVDIGAGTIDICPLYGVYPADDEQVTVPLGGDYIDEQLFRRFSELCPDSRLSMNMIRDIKEKFGFVHDVNEKAIVTLPIGGKPKPVDVTDILKAACKMIVPPIIQGIREVVAPFDPELQQRLLNNIILGGGGSQLRGLDRVIEEGLKEFGGAKVKKVYDAVFAGAAGALKLAMNMPPAAWEKLSGGRKPYSAAPTREQRRAA